MYLAIILGTRPEIIKMAPVVWKCAEKNIPYFILHTGQHYTPNMDEIFFRDLNLPAPKYNLSLGQMDYGNRVGLFTKNIIRILKKEKPDVVLVQGDTTSVVAGALSAVKLGIKLAHHEAGLRSHDTGMLEEVNRVITDHISDLLFTPTQNAADNLIVEGVEKNKIFLTGNTIVDVVNKYSSAIARSNALQKMDLEEKKYFLVTAHRPENVDNRSRLQNIFSGLKLLKENYPDAKIIFPLHLRTKKSAEKFKISIPAGIQVVEPVNYFSMLALESGARLIITDSGGIQEEACVLRVPAVTIRDNTERPETVAQGFNILVPGVSPEDILQKAKEMLGREHKWTNFYGNGDAADKIVDYLAGKIKL